MRQSRPWIWGGSNSFTLQFTNVRVTRIKSPCDTVVALTVTSTEASCASTGIHEAKTPKQARVRFEGRS